MYYFIVNPVAGKGRALQKFQQLQQTSSFPKECSIVYMTTGPNDAANFVASLVKDDKISSIKLLVVIGGDGTIHEVLNGLGDAHASIHYIKSGSGNDFYRGISEMKEDIISYYTGEFIQGGKKKVFVNCIGFGFDALVAKLANESKVKRLFNVVGLGRMVYVLALIRALFMYTPTPMQLKIDDKTYHFDKTLFVVVNNHPYMGGGMKINPFAVHDKEDLFAIVAHDLPKWKILLLFLTVFFGMHTRFQGVTTFRGKKMDIRTKNNILFQTDGEVNETNGAQIYKTGHYVTIHKHVPS